MRAAAVAVLAVLCALTFAGFLARFGWPFELLGFFRPHYVALAFVAGLVLLPFRLFVSAAAAFVLVAVNVVAVGPWERPAHAPPAGPARLRVLLVNVLKENEDYTAVAELVRETHPDFVGLTELTPAWSRRLTPVLEKFRARVVRPEQGSFGIGLYSRVPLARGRIVRFGSGTPSVTARVRLGAATITFVLVHPPAPYSLGNSSRHRSEYRALAEARLARPLAICGDLNATPWSWAYDHLVTKSDLTDATRDRLDGTWPSMLPGFLRIPIDTCLLSEGVTVTERRTGPNVGSDHLPVLLELAPA